MERNTMARNQDEQKKILTEKTEERFRVSILKAPLDTKIYVLANQVRSVQKTEKRKQHRYFR